MPASQDPTSLLNRWAAGDAEAMNEVVALFYRQMHRIAALQLRGEHQLTVQPTQLVNEVYLRLVELRRMEWQDRNHFLAMFARFARRALVDEARRRSAAKRDGGRAVTLHTQIALAATSDLDVLEVDELLERFADIDEVAARVVELRVFAGLGLDAIALELDVSLSTVSRKWRAAKAWLARELATPAEPGH